jgi:Tfp pilus assembly protein PilZ
MLINYNDNYPRTAGGYSLETYEPAVINPNQRNRAEDLIKMTFSNKKPIATVRRIIRRTPQVNILPTHVLQNINYVPAQNIPVANIGTNMNGYQIINQAPNNVYRYNNFQRPNVISIVKTNNSFVGNNPYLHQNLINVTNKYQLATKIVQFPINNGNRFIASGFNNQGLRPIMRSNSATNNYNSILTPRIIQTSIINGQNYNLSVYKRYLN